MAGSPDWVMAPGTSALLLALVLGVPIGLVVLIVAKPALGESSAAASGPAMAKAKARSLPVHAPVLSPTHWNRYIVTRTDDDGGVYARNYAIAHDEGAGEAVENEEERIFIPYPVGAVVSKEHFPDAKTAAKGESLEFVTRMVRTASAHGTAGDMWRYERLDADGRMVFSGFADDPMVRQQCATCHENAQHRDFIFHNHFGDK